MQVYSTKLANPAFEVGFTSISFDRPDARQFDFNPPPGTKVTESGALTGDKTRPDAAHPAKPKVVGTGWGAVAVGTLPADATSGQGAEQAQGLLQALPKVSGSWGSGRLLSGTLFSAVLTDDGRFAVGAVAPERLYAALAAR